MAIDDTQPIPVEERLFVRQNLFSSIYKPPTSDAINVNIYQDFAYSKIGTVNSFLMTTGVNVVVNHFLEFGPFCTYLGAPQSPTITDPNAPAPIPEGNVERDTLTFVNYFYCGAMFGYIPLAKKVVHPKVFLDIGMGGMNGEGASKLGIPSAMSYSFLVLKPALAAEVNLFSFLQWTAAVQYRFQIGLGNEYEVKNAKGTYTIDERKVGNDTGGIEVSTGFVFQF